VDNDAFPGPVEETAGEALPAEIKRIDRTSMVLDFIAGPPYLAARPAIAAPARSFDPEDVSGPELDVDLRAQRLCPAAGDERIFTLAARPAAACPVGCEPAALRHDRQRGEDPEFVLADDPFATPVKPFPA
jgi:hypothetical protein